MTSKSRTAVTRSLVVLIALLGGVLVLIAKPLAFRSCESYANRNLSVAKEVSRLTGDARGHIQHWGMSGPKKYWVVEELMRGIELHAEVPIQLSGFGLTCSQSGKPSATIEAVERQVLADGRQRTTVIKAVNLEWEIILSSTREELLEVFYSSE